MFLLAESDKIRSPLKSLIVPLPTGLSFVVKKRFGIPFRSDYLCKTTHFLLQGIPSLISSDFVKPKLKSKLFFSIEFQPRECVTDARNFVEDNRQAIRSAVSQGARQKRDGSRLG